jgi:hypothetical protein
VANEPRSGERIFRRYAAHLPLDKVTTAFSRGYILSPLQRLTNYSRVRPSELQTQ